MAKIIIGLTGPIASGKDAVKKYIEKKYGGKDCRFSSILRDVLNRIDVPIQRGNLQKISTALRQTFGEDVLAKAIAKDVADLNADIIVVDGVRRMTDIKYLETIPGFVLAKIDADPKIRYERMRVRNENANDSKKSYDEFLNDHTSEADREVPEVMKHASISIDNSGTFEGLYNQIDEIIKKLKVA